MSKHVDTAAADAELEAQLEKSYPLEDKFINEAMSQLTILTICQVMLGGKSPSQMDPVMFAHYKQELTRLLVMFPVPRLMQLVLIAKRDRDTRIANAAVNDLVHNRLCTDAAATPAHPEESQATGHGEPGTTPPSR